MNKVMLGADFSRYQWDLYDPSSLSFIWLKATEGKSYQDPHMNDYIKLISTNVMENQQAMQMPFIGFYHFARIDNGNTPQQEAENFINTILPHIPNCMVALDVESQSLDCKNKDEWSAEWCDIVRSYELNPCLYISYAYLNYFPITLSKNELWLARYNNEHGLERNRNPLFWQRIASPFDIDIFYGDRADMIRFITKYHKGA